MDQNLAKVLWYYNLIPTVELAEQKIVCPFHKDVNPSMIVDLASNRWYCFGCGRSGDAYKFVYEMERRKNKNINTLDAAIKYQKILKSKKTSDIKIKYKYSLKSKKNSKELYDISYDYYHGLSKVDWCKDSDIPEIEDVKEYMLNRGFSLSTLNTVGAKVTYNSNYQLILPLVDNGKFKGWVSRTFVKEIEAKRKYLYNTGFKRSTTLCGEYGKKDYVIVVEGFMDRLSFIEAGIEPDNIVAILGWKMSEQQQKKLKSKGVKYIISALDNDIAGKKGTTFLKTTDFKVVRFKYLKGIKDPGEMSKNQLLKCYKKTMSVFNNTIESLKFIKRKE